MKTKNRRRHDESLDDDTVTPGMSADDVPPYSRAGLADGVTAARSIDDLRPDRLNHVHELLRLAPPATDLKEIARLADRHELYNFDYHPCQESAVKRAGGGRV